MFLAVAAVLLLASSGQAADMQVDKAYKAAHAAAVNLAPGPERAAAFEKLAENEARAHDEAENYAGTEAWAWTNAAYEWMKLGLSKEAAKADASEEFVAAARAYANAAECEDIPADCKTIVARNQARLTARGVKAPTK
jgi:hypothetical protein